MNKSKILKNYLKKEELKVALFLQKVGGDFSFH